MFREKGNWCTHWQFWQGLQLQHSQILKFYSISLDMWYILLRLMWVSDALSFHELKNCYFITSINLIVAFKTASKQYLANSVTKIITHANYPYTNTVVSFLCRKLDYITNSQWFKSYDVSIFFLPFHFHLDIEMTVFFHFLKFVCFFSCNSNSTTKIMEIFQKKTYQILKMFLLKTFIFTVLISKIIYMYIIDIYITDIYI